MKKFEFRGQKFSMGARFVFKGPDAGGRPEGRIQGETFDGMAAGQIVDAAPKKPQTISDNEIRNQARVRSLKYLKDTEKTDNDDVKAKREQVKKQLEQMEEMERQGFSAERNKRANRLGTSLMGILGGDAKVEGGVKYWNGEAKKFDKGVTIQTVVTEIASLEAEQLAIDKKITQNNERIDEIGGEKTVAGSIKNVEDLLAKWNAVYPAVLNIPEKDRNDAQKGNALKGAGAIEFLTQQLKDLKQEKATLDEEVKAFWAERDVVATQLEILDKKGKELMAEATAAEEAEAAKKKP